VIGLHRRDLPNGVIRMLCALLQFRLVGVGGEQTPSPADPRAPGAASPRTGPWSKRFSSLRFLDQVVAGDDHQRRAHHVEPEDRPELFPPAAPRCCNGWPWKSSDKHVADHRLLRRDAGIGFNLLDGRHRKSLLLPRAFGSKRWMFTPVIASEAKQSRVPGSDWIASFASAPRNDVDAPVCYHPKPLPLRHSMIFALTPRPAFVLLRPMGRCRGPGIFEGSGMIFSMPSGGRWGQHPASFSAMIISDGTRTV